MPRQNCIDEDRSRGFFGDGGPFGSNFCSKRSCKQRDRPDKYADDDEYRSFKPISANTCSAGKSGRPDDFFDPDEFSPPKPQKHTTSRESGNTGSTYDNPTVEYTVNVKLEEIYSGCTKKMKIPRTVTIPGDSPARVEEKEFTIDVKPGWKAGTKITFHREGEQLYKNIPGDVVFIIRDEPHPHFKRHGQDVRHVAKIAFKKALRGGTIDVPTLTHGKITVQLTDIVTPTTIKRIPGQGLPHPKDPQTRGDLILSFDIEYPRLVTESESRAFWDQLSRLI